MERNGKRAFECIAALALAVVVFAGVQGAAIVPQKAYAQQGLAAAQTTEAADSASVSEQASKATVYVISKANGEKYKYNDKGLVVRMKNSYNKVTFGYSGTHMTTFASKPVSKYVIRSSSGKMTYKAGRLKKMQSWGTHGSNTYTYNYKYNRKGKMTKIVGEYSSQKMRKTFSYNEKGQVVRCASRYKTGFGWSKPSVTRYSYNSKGYLSKTVETYGSGSSWQTTYDYKYNKKGLPASVTSHSGSSTSTTKFKYKKIKVAKKYVSAAKKQQKKMLNQNPDQTLPSF